VDVEVEAEVVEEMLARRSRRIASRGGGEQL